MFVFEMVPNTDCNLCCYFCFASNKQTGEFTSVEKLQEALDHIDELTTERDLLFKYYGGETMLHQTKLLEHFRFIEAWKLSHPEKKCNIALITNGTIYPKEEMLEFWKKPWVDIGISMEVNQTFHDQIRHFANGTGSFHVVMNNIRKLVPILQHPIRIQTVTSKEWMLHIKDYIQFLETYQDWVVGSLSPFIENEITEDMLPLIEPAFTTLRNYYVDRWKQGKDCNYVPFQEARSLIQLGNILTSSSHSGSHCGAGVTQLCIIRDQYHACSKAYHSGLHKLAYTSIQDFIEQKDRYQEIVTMDSECQYCQHSHHFGCTGICLYGCLENQNQKNPYTCYFNQKLGTHARLLWEELCYDPEFRQYIVSIVAGSTDQHFSFFQDMIETLYKQEE